MMDSIFLQIKNKNSFLDDINKFVDWKAIERILKRKIKPTTDATGKPSYCVLKMFKVVLLQILSKLSDRKIAFTIFDSILSRKFTGFLYKHRTPSFATICRFRNKLFELGLDREIFYITNEILRKKKLISKTGIIIDSSVILSSRRPRKTVRVDKNNVVVSYSNDTEANWLSKNGHSFYGFKLHMSVDTVHGFITEGHITPASFSDIGEFLKLVYLNSKNLTVNSPVLADKIYFSQKNIEILSFLNYSSGLMHRKPKKKELSKSKKEENKKISKTRVIIERIFGTLKTNYNFFRSKFLGIAKTTGQFLLSAIAYNLKKASMLTY